MMNTTSQLAKHLRDVHFGGNWTWVNLKDTLADLSWQEATTSLYSFNSIAALVYHIHYFIGAALLKVLEGEPLTANDKYSFDLPPISSQEDWEELVSKTWADMEKCTVLIEKLPESILGEVFTNEKYGSYHRNLLGIIEHTHYHLGQIVIIKKLIREIKAAG